MYESQAARPKLKPLNVTCTSTDCENGLHCFKKSRQMAEADKGHCRACGVDLIDWHRVHQRDAKDGDFVFASLRNEYVRHHYWHKPIDIRAENHARRKGIIKLQAAVVIRLQKSLSPANYRDGMQTPREGNII